MHEPFRHAHILYFSYLCEPFWHSGGPTYLWEPFWHAGAFSYLCEPFWYAVALTCMWPFLPAGVIYRISIMACKYPCALHYIALARAEGYALYATIIALACTTNTWAWPAEGLMFSGARRFGHSGRRHEAILAGTKPFWHSTYMGLYAIWVRSSHQRETKLRER